MGSRHFWQHELHIARATWAFALARERRGWVYKRVPTGTAIAALGLDMYRAAPVQTKDLIDLAELNAVASGAREYVDRGTTTLQFGRLIWNPSPTATPRPAVSLVLQNRDGAPFGAPFSLVNYDTLGWRIDVDTDRPKSGVVHFADGTESAPVQIADLDVLAMTTQPPAQGRKKSLNDSLGEQRTNRQTLLMIGGPMGAGQRQTKMEWSGGELGWAVTGTSGAIKK